MQYILQETSESRIQKFFLLQLKEPTRGDWASSCLKDLKDLEIKISLEEIKILTKTKFAKLLKEAIRPKALAYLVKKQGKKGQEITYSELKMAEYLMPNLENISIEDRRTIFEIRKILLLYLEMFHTKNSIQNISCMK